MNFLKSFLVVAILVSSIGLPMPVLAAGETAAQRINMAGRQRMLTQRMSAASCMALAGVGGQTRRDVASDAHAEFGRALLTLRDGDAGLGMAAEHDTDVRAALAEVWDIWQSFGPAIQQLSHDDVHGIAVRQMLTRNLPALKASNAAVQQIVRAHAGGGVTGGAIARAIDIAGRQRMLSQKMMKEGCFLVVGLDPARAEADLTATIAEFDRALFALRQGDAEMGVPIPPDTATAARLDAVAQLWRDYKAALEALRPPEGGEIALDQLPAVATMSDDILVAAHAAVVAYVASRSGR